MWCAHMVPKLHKKGKSFKGAAAYLLHDKDRAQTSDRVAWTHARNLAHDNPDIAWRIMAATAIDQDRLKAQAGVKNTGRKSADHVLHFTLAWHPEEKGTLTRDVMLGAAEAAIRALGASDRQAVIIAHDDEAHPHLHVLLNRVSPEDGRLLSSSKEKLNLSKWAEAYERERGKIYCEDRVLNNAERDREMKKSKKDREFVRGTKDRPRHFYEQEKELRPAANDNRAETIRDAQRKLDAALAQRGRDVHKRHAEAFDQLAERQRARQAEALAQAQRSIGSARADIRSHFRPEYRELEREQQDQLAAFQQRETKILGRLGNIWDALKLAQQVRGDDPRTSTLGESWNLLSSAGARLEALEKAHMADRRAIEARQREEERQQAEAIKEQQRQHEAANRARFTAERSDILLEQAADQAKLRAEWRTRNERREVAFAELTPQRPPAPQQDRAQDQSAGPPDLQEDFGKAAEPQDRQSSSSGEDAYAAKLAEMQADLESHDHAREQDNSRDTGDRDRDR